MANSSQTSSRRPPQDSYPDDLPVALLTDSSNSQNIIIAVYLFIFGLGTGLLEFQIPPPVAKYASFMFSFLGRGVFYIFVGMISCGGEKWWRWVAGVVVAAIGLGYVVLEFIPSIEPPANMREAEQGWGQEQI